MFNISDEALQQFLVEMQKKKKRSDCEPSSLANMQAPLECHY